MSELLLCGATGDLGGRIAARLAERRVPFRALVRPNRDTAARASLPCPTCGRPLTIYLPTGPDDRRQSRLQCRTPTCLLAMEDEGGLAALR